MSKQDHSLEPIPMSSPDLTAAEREAVAAVLRTPRLSMGPEEKGFEAAIAEYVGVEHAIAVNSGTSGLHICVRTASIGEQDLVITTPYSFVSSTNVLLYERAVPVFVDIDPQTGNLDPAQVEQAAHDLSQGGAAAARWLPRKGAENPGPLKALISVDVFGQPADYDRLKTVVDAHGIVLIEDSCEALGAKYKARNVGTFGDLAVFAFYPNKQITTGEGGMVVTNRQDWADIARALRNQGRAPGDTWLSHSCLGYNYRIDEMSAALGRAQMGRLDALLEKRAQVAAWYNERISEIPGIEIPQVDADTTRMSWFVYVVRFTPDVDRDVLVGRLAQRGIPARPYFAPIHLQTYMQERFGYRPGDYPLTEDVGQRSLALPFSSVMGEGQVDRVCQCLRELVRP